jgi:hypothetical protein
LHPRSFLHETTLDRATQISPEPTRCGAQHWLIGNAAAARRPGGQTQARTGTDGVTVARCTVERLMRAEGLSGARRGNSFSVALLRFADWIRLALRRQGRVATPPPCG